MELIEIMYFISFLATYDQWSNIDKHTGHRANHPLECFKHPLELSGGATTHLAPPPWTQLKKLPSPWFTEDPHKYLNTYN